MRRQRNNVTRLPYEQRRLVSRLLVDGATFGDVNAEVRRQFPGAPRLHNSTLGAWQRSPEYLRYREAREKDQAETDAVRSQAEAVNDGRGPESYADLVVMEIVRSLHAATAAGQLSDLNDLAAATRAIAPILRAKVAAESAADRKREADLGAEIARLKEQATAENAENAEKLAAKDAEIARLKGSDAARPGGLSPEALKQIEQSAKLL